MFDEYGKRYAQIMMKEQIEDENYFIFLFKY